MEQKLQNLPIGIQNFESLRNDGYLYIDKTGIMHQLVSTGRYYFLSRPRRFGKSMLISTLRAYFEGKKDLFKGLAIEQLETEWVKYPILHLDLNTQKYDGLDSLNERLEKSIREWEEQYDCIAKYDSFGLRFEHVIQRAFEKTGQRVVVLVDEYDKPILQAIGREDLQNEYRATLKGFYGALKSMDAYIKFAMLTGVTKFGKVSVFSDLNNLDDISMNKKYYNICGITEEELQQALRPYVERLAEEQELTVEEAYAQLRKQYDGYHFTYNVPGLYNPFSVLKALNNMDFGSYWFETGTPSYLVELLKKHNYDLERMSHEEVTADVLNSVDIASTNPIPVIFQSGYLTIKEYDKEFKLYKLGFPNSEVEEGFVNYLMPFYTPIKNSSTGFEITNFVKEIRRGEIDAFMNRLKSFFADTPYELVKELENHYQNVLFILCRLAGFHVKAEYHTSAGRIDMTMETSDFCYVFEFKFEGSAEEALQQIKDKHYTQPFEASGKKIICIGANFKHELRNIERYVVE